MSFTLHFIFYPSFLTLGSIPLLQKPLVILRCTALRSGLWLMQMSEMLQPATAPFSMTKLGCTLTLASIPATFSCSFQECSLPRL
jgi:hypothetical protein